jgi:hypothetical protein
MSGEAGSHPGDAEGRVPGSILQQPTPSATTDPSKNVDALVEAAMRRQDDMRVMESAHVREMMLIRAGYDEKLRQAETNRIDAIRQVDVGAVQRAAEVQAAQQQALAAQVVATADAFRVSIAAALEPIQKDIRDLRDAQSRGVGGKEQVVESRDVRGEARLSQGTLISLALLVIAVLTFIALYVAKK